jgi:hypothetical protein
MRGLLPTPVVAVYGAATVLLAAHAALLAYLVRPTAEPRVLHYTTVFGIDLVGAGTRLYLLPGVGLAALVLNAVLAAVLRSDRVAQLLAAATLGVELALAAATLAIARQTLP